MTKHKKIWCHVHNFFKIDRFLWFIIVWFHVQTHCLAKRIESCLNPVLIVKIEYVSLCVKP